MVGDMAQGTFSARDRLAAPQLGLATRPQLAMLGWDDDRLATGVRRGDLFRLHQGVYRLSGTTTSIRRRLLAACLAAGPEAAASHRAALWLWQLDDQVPPIEITVPYANSPRVAEAVIHRSQDLSSDQVILRRLVPVTKPARTLLDAGAVLPRYRVGRCVELALTRKLVTVAGLRRCLDEFGRRGRRGAGALRSYLDHRALGDRRPESALEPLMARLCRDHEVGPVLFQAPLVLDGRRLRVDFLIERSRLVIEVDGLDAHRDRGALDNDLERQNLLVRHGYLVLRYTVTHLRRPAAVAREIIAVARDRRSQLLL